MSELEYEIPMIGLIGLGIATNMVYYNEIMASRRRNGNLTTRLVLDTIEVSAASDSLKRNDIDALIHLVVESGKRLRSAGATHLAIASNTAHVAAPMLRDTVLPVIDLRDAFAAEVSRKNVRQLGLLSTIATQQLGLYDSIENDMNVEVTYPSQRTSAAINNVILDELVQGKTHGQASKVLEHALNELRDAGCDAIALACTDMTLVHHDVAAADVIDTTLIHARAIGAV